MVRTCGCPTRATALRRHQPDPATDHRPASAAWVHAMKVDAKFDSHGSIDVAARAIELEAAGFDAAWTSESAHDPFLPLMVAAANTDRLRIGTAVAVAFARSPMNVAHLANDLQL